MEFDSIEVLVEREGPAVKVISAGGKQPMEVVVASVEPAVLKVSSEGMIKPVAKPEEPIINIMGESVEPAVGLRVPKSLPPAPLRGSWNRSSANYEEARKRLMQAPATPDLAEKGREKVPPSKLRLSRIAAPPKPLGAHVGFSHTPVIASQWRKSCVEHTVIAGAAAQLGARDDRDEPKVSDQLRSRPAETGSVPSRVLSDVPKASAPSKPLPDAPRASAPSRALHDQPRSSALLSEPVPRPVRVAAPNPATLDHNFMTTTLARSPPPLLICNDTIGGIPSGAVKPLAKARRKAKALQRAANPPRAPKAKKSGANSFHLTEPPTQKLKLWALLLVLGFWCLVGFITIFALVY